MGPIARLAGKEVAGKVLHEAAEELSGRSNRKWAVMLLAFLIGIVATVIVIKRRGGTLPIENDPRWSEMTDTKFGA
ncbi:MAG: hypothetical protein E4H05_01340 [Acidimicrobiales bacterium]|nr:MAG: hypothetical protein E4H05_01340 [Acidimicrobiales bacterium]